MSERPPIEHIVVLMMENRSFDHMLGYLSLPEAMGGRGRSDVNGLHPGHANSHAGQEHPVHALDDRPELTKAEDPSHSARSVDAQLKGGMAGFVSNFAATRNPEEIEHAISSGQITGIDPSVVMGYHTARVLPAYDFLAENFTICDRWFSSVPGATWPNRLYALTGGPDRKGSRDGRNPPLYRHRSFLRELDHRGVTWRWYSSDPGTLRAVDWWYRLGPDDNFAFLESRSLLEAWNFFDDVAQKRLPQLAWLDPNFVDIGGSFGANDDHPPSNVLAGQDLVLRVYNALAQSKYYWPKTLFVIFYDEHGGFYDHVTPPGTPDAPPAGEPPADDRPALRRYGVRVPALVVSPYARARHVAKETYDHTSVMATVLRTFCPGEADSIMARFGQRVASANDLLPVLSTEPRPEVPQPPEEAYETILAWATERFEAGLRKPLPVEPPWDLGEIAGGKLRALLRKQVQRLRKQLGWLRDLLWRLTGRRRLFAGLMRPEETRLKAPPGLEREMLELSKSIRGRGLPPGKP